MSHNIRHFIATALAMSALAGAANAQAPLLVGSSVDPPLIGGPFTPAGTPFGGAAFNGSVFFTESSANGDSVTGNIYYATYDRDPGVNVFLDFYYQIEVTSVVGGGSVDNFGISSFLGFTTDVGEIAVNPNIALFTAGSDSIISATRPNPGSGLNQGFSSALVLGRGNTYLVSTNANSAVTGSLSFSGGGVGGDRPVPAPLAGGVQGPEPASILLTTLGLVAFGGVAARRRK